MGSGLPSVFLGIALAHSTTTFSMVPTGVLIQSAAPIHRIQALRRKRASDKQAGEGEEGTV